MSIEYESKGHQRRVEGRRRSREIFDEIVHHTTGLNRVPSTAHVQLLDEILRRGLLRFHPKGSAAYKTSGTGAGERP